MNVFSIKQIEAFTGIKAHTIRAWEQRYSFFKSKRTSTNIRTFDTQDLHIILNICFLTKKGHKLCELDQMSTESIKQLVDQYILTQPETQILQSLLLHCINLEMTDFEQEIDRLIEQHSFDFIAQNILWPLVTKMQQLQITRIITDRHKALYSEILRRKLYTQIDKLKTQNLPQTSTRALLFCVEGEQDDLKLLTLSYLLQAQGVNVIYAGADFPAAEISCLSHKLPADLVIIKAGIGKKKAQNLKKSLENVKKYYPDSQIGVTGALCENLSIGQKSDIMSICSPADVKNYLQFDIKRPKFV